MNDNSKSRSHDLWAQLRFAIVGLLLSSPPLRGELAGELRRMAAKTWSHPITGKPVKFALPTIERWYYAAKAAHRDPIGSLRRKVRQDSGQQSAMSDPLRQRLIAQHRDHPRWSYQLHTDNLAALVKADPTLGQMPSYSTVRRFMHAAGLHKRRRPRNTEGAQRAAHRLETREVRSYEVEHVHGLWHLDFHHCSRKIITAGGQWVTPLLLGILDDCSRLSCHLQWYLAETAENLVHGLCQAFQKRALPWKLMTHNGAAMVAAETTEGLSRLSVIHETTLPESPYQNGKQENFWAQVEGRVMAMLEGVNPLTLPLLNEATLAWMEMEYNRKTHSEISQTPLEKYLKTNDIGRPCPSSEDLRQAFTMEISRTQRRSDGTVTVDGQRFEIANRYRNLRQLAVRYARWDLSQVYLVDGRTGTVLCRLFPQDKLSNADGRRRVLTPGLFDTFHAEQTTPAGSVGIAPLLARLMADYAATGLPPAYIPKDEVEVMPEAADRAIEEESGEEIVS